ncbi:MAG: CoA transferase, partial [Solirubrobacterales bacterium]
GPKPDASGHDMNYLGLVGLLGLTGERGGEPVQAAGQIADLGGGALMAAFGILAALRERDGAPAHRSAQPVTRAQNASAGGDGEPPEPARAGSGLGQMVDVSMADGALSWLAMVAGAYFADGSPPRRGELLLAGSVVCYRPYECADGWVTLGALEPKFWQAWCRGVEREDLIEKQFEAPGSEAHAQVVEIFKSRTRAQWQQFAGEHDCCLEPILELDEALDSELVRAREMVVALQQPGVAGGVRQLGIPVKLTRTPGDHNRLPGPALGEHTEEVLAAAGYAPADIAALLESGAVAGPATNAGQGATFRA